MQTTELSLTPTAAAEALVDLDAIADNVRLLRERAGSAQVMTVVKADGYGHGASHVARAALAAGAAELGVATIDEALALRRDGISSPVPAPTSVPVCRPTSRSPCPRSANSKTSSTPRREPDGRGPSQSRSTPA
jgi:alanine racemase